MCAFPFEISKNRTTYKVTFLQSVFLKMEYDPRKETSSKFAHFFKDTFGIDIDVRQYNVKNTDAIRLRAANGSLRFKISNDTIEFIISGESYINFEKSLRPYIEKIANYLSDIQSSINNLSIEKINIWPLINGNVDDPDDFINVIISSNLRDTQENNKKEISFIEYSDPQFQDSLLIRFGYIPFTAQRKEQPSRIILDTLCKHDSVISPENLIPAAIRLNDILYSAYHWSVTENVIKSMKL